MTPPDKIYLQFHGDGDPEDETPVDPLNVTWSKDRVYESDIEYQRTATALGVDVVQRISTRIATWMIGDERFKDEIARIIAEEVGR